MNMGMACRGKRRVVVCIVSAAIAVVCGVGYWWVSRNHDNGSTEMPLPGWMQVSPDAVIIVSRGPRRVEMLHEGPVQYIRVRFPGSVESAQATLDGMLRKWNPAGDIPKWKVFRPAMRPRQDQPKWLRDLMMDDDMVAGCRWAEVSDGAATYIEMVVVPDGSWAIAEIVITTTL